MDVKDIRPGMVGIGRTVFDGTQVEEFKANIIGVLENVIGHAPQPDPRAGSKAGRSPTPASSPA